MKSNSKRQPSDNRKGRKRPTNKQDNVPQGKERSDDNPSKVRQSGHKSYGDKRLSSLNDLSWYTRYPILVESTAKVPFPYRPGRIIDFGTMDIGTTSAPATAKFQYSIPGVMRLTWAPSIGYSGSLTDPASIAAKEIYAKVRSKFSGSLEADPPDFLVYMMCLDSIFSYIGALKRIYRLLTAYSPDNYTIPDMILFSMGIRQNSLNDLQANRAQFCYIINQLIYQSRKFAMPATMDIFNRHYWLNDNVYTDDATINSQFYVFNQVGFYTFALLDTNGAVPNSGGIGAGGCKMQKAPWADDLNLANGTVENLFQYGQQMIEALAASDDAYTISGYLMRAYEGSPQFVVDELLPTETFTPVYVPEVLMQIENSTGVCGVGYEYSVGNLYDVNIWQDPATNLVLHKPRIPRTACALPNVKTFDVKNVLNIRSEAPSVAEVLISTRLKAALRPHPTDSSSFQIISGTEIPMGWSVFRFSQTMEKQQGDGVKYGWYTVPSFANVPSSPTAGSETDKVLKVWLGLLAQSAFDWSPIVQVMVTNGTATTAGNMGTQQYTSLYGDIHNVTKVEDEDLSEIHRVCIYSELNAFSE